jgi:hydroxymethylglutaryl-CoA reductase
MSGARTSRLAGFYKISHGERLEALAKNADLDAECHAFLHRGGGLELPIADRMSENVIATFGFPLSVALNFRINGTDRLVPMATEEPSVVAAASNAARMVRVSGGFQGEADPPLMIAQIQLDGVERADGAGATIADAHRRILALGDASIPRMVERGGGCRSLEVRVLDPEEGMIVVHILVDVGDAMGANLVDTVAEAVAPAIQGLVGGRIGLRILSNLPIHRRVRVRAQVSSEAIGGADVADAVARASRFAELDPFRAVTHNKGFMNGVDATAIALGQDFRSIEAAAHAFAAIGEGTRSGYRPLSTWRRTQTGLSGLAELPMAVGTVGGSCRAHAGVRTAFRILGVDRAGELGIVLASVGLASNLAALRALATEGIQKGHMRLHRRKDESAGRSGEGVAASRVRVGGAS